MIHLEINISSQNTSIHMLQIVDKRRKSTKFTLLKKEFFFVLLMLLAYQDRQLPKMISPTNVITIFFGEMPYFEAWYKRKRCQAMSILIFFVSFFPFRILCMSCSTILRMRLCIWRTWVILSHLVIVFAHTYSWDLFNNSIHIFIYDNLL